MKSRYGVTPWGAWFIEVLDSYEMGERLNRGRTYANTGRVLSLEFNQGRAVAKVEGNYRPFYRVEIGFPPLEEAERVYRLIEDDPPLLSRIAAGDLPETFLEKLLDNDIELIPSDWYEMERSCTCPDDGDPCKHMAALYYIIAREIDADPRLLFKLRGMDLAARFGKAAVHSIAPPFAITFAAPDKNAQSASGRSIPAAGALPELEEIPRCGELISTLLPAAPPFSERDFSAVMAEFFHRCAAYEAASHEAWVSAGTGGQALDDTEHHFSRSHWTVLCPNPAPGAEAVLLAEDINGNKKRYSLTEVFENFVSFTSDDGDASYSFLFYLFKFLNLIIDAGAFIPYVLAENDTLKIIWRPYEGLPAIQRMLETIALHECGMLSVKTQGKNAARKKSAPGPEIQQRPSRFS